MSEIRTWTCNRCGLGTSADHGSKDCISALRHRLMNVSAERDKMAATISGLRTELERPAPKAGKLTIGSEEITWAAVSNAVLPTLNLAPNTIVMAPKYAAGDYVRVSWSESVVRLVKPFPEGGPSAWIIEYEGYPHKDGTQFPSWDREGTFRGKVSGWNG